MGLMEQSRFAEIRQNTDNFSYEQNLGAWVVWNNDESTAAHLKLLYPEQPVLLYNSATKQYVRYLIEIPDRSFTWIGSEMHVIENTRKV